MRNSVTKPSSVILGQIKYFQKLQRDVTEVPKEADAKRDGVINPQNYDFNQFYMENFEPLKTL